MPEIDVQFRNDVTVSLVKAAASDRDALWAARVSTAGETHMDDTGDLTPRDIRLINFLMQDRHGSPFEHTSFTFHVEAPIFVFREWHRHRAGWSYNEQSGRYRKLDPVFYVINDDRRLVQQGKPGAYTFEQGSPRLTRMTQERMAESGLRGYEQYLAMMESGVAREVARTALPLGTYSSMYATCNARSLMHFLSLRTSHEDAAYPSHPQREIEMCAERMEAIFAEHMPHTYRAYATNGRVAP